MDMPGPIDLPCPLSAGWRIVEQTVLPRTAGGGFSAGVYRGAQDELWLLSDAPNGSISRWRGLRQGGLAGLQPLPPLPLAQPQPMDGEGLVVEGADLWAASEGRLQPQRPAELLRYDLGTGQLQQRVALPTDWQLQPAAGLRSNGGPESLTRLPGSDALLMAAEQPLLQDPPDRVRLLRWQRRPAAAPQATALQPLALPSGGWGLTDLLASSRGLLGLWRRFEAPDQWQARLVLYRVPGADPAAAPLATRQQHLPVVVGQTQTVQVPLLASDDNFNPLQASHLVRLSPVQHPDCKP